MSTPVADFTPHEVHLQLRRNSYKKVIFRFSETSFTGYTQPTMKIAKIDGTGTVSITGSFNDSGTDGVIEIELNSTHWLMLGSIPTKGIYQLSVVRPDLEVEHLAEGNLSIEAGL